MRPWKIRKNLNREAELAVGDARRLRTAIKHLNKVLTDCDQHSNLSVKLSIREVHSTDDRGRKSVCPYVDIDSCLTRGEEWWKQENTRHEPKAEGSDE